MKEIMLLGNMRDLQTGMYIVKSIEELGHKATFVDTRAITNDVGYERGQGLILGNIMKHTFKPDIIIVLKGLEMSYETTKAIKEMFPNAVFTNWFFDVYLADKKIWENDKFYKVIELYDLFMCSLKGVADNLKLKGFNNAVHVPEGCFPALNGEQYLNNFQVGKYGSDVAFIGSIGMLGIHKNRVKLLSKIASSGFDLKIWGEIVGEQKAVPLDVRHAMTNESVINERHSQVCQASLVNIGIDQDPTLRESWSARIYRVMCAGGLYLTTPTKGIQDLFKINHEGEEITADQDLVVFYSDNDLVKKIDFLLEHDDIRESIAKNGQKKVMDEHTFVHRVKEIIEVTEKWKKQN
jgi:spore maturation protein CgeB